MLVQNKETGEIACREVASPYANPSRAIILVTLESVDGVTEVIETTDNHPFYLVALEWAPTYERVYNFGVDEFYTYFVGELGAWVHNCGGKVWSKRGRIKAAQLPKKGKIRFISGRATH